MKVVLRPDLYSKVCDSITPGKVYDVISILDYEQYYIIKNDSDEIKSYYYGRFITLEEYRENLIEDILK